MNTEGAFESLDKQTRLVVNKTSQKQEKIPAIVTKRNKNCKIVLGL